MRKNRKLFAIMLCLILAIATLSACSGNNKPEEDVSSSLIEEVIAQETSEETTPDAESVDESTSMEETQEDIIIPLFPEASGEQVHQLTPEELQQSENFLSLFNAYDSGKVFGTESDDNRAAHLYTTEYMDRAFDIGYQQPNGTTISVTFYFVGPIPGVNDSNSYIYDNMYYEIEGGESGTLVLIMPLYYNQSKQCLVAYRKKAGVYSLCEIYYDGTAFSSQIVEDTSIYGF